MLSRPSDPLIPIPSCENPCESYEYDNEPAMEFAMLPARLLLRLCSGLYTTPAPTPTALPLLVCPVRSAGPFVSQMTRDGVVGREMEAPMIDCPASGDVGRLGSGVKRPFVLR
jgi:hypothetical protein